MTHLSVVLIWCCMYLTHQGALAAAGWWMVLPYNSSKDFNYRVQFGTNVTLECSDTIVPDDYEVQYWIRPDLQVMYPDDNFDHFWTIDGMAGWTVNSTSRNMQITRLQENQFGFYHCVLSSSSGDMRVVKKAVNYKGPYFGRLWPKYRMNTIIGGGAAGGFLVVAIIVFVACKCTYHDEEEEDDNELKEKDSNSNIEPTSGGSNYYKAYEPEGSPGSTSSNVSFRASKKEPTSHDNEAYERDGTQF